MAYPCSRTLDVRIGALVVLIGTSLQAAATTGEDGSAPRPFTTICEISDTCHVGGGCATLPAPGAIIVAFDGSETAMGQREDALDPIDRFARIEDAHPLPRLDGERREFLLDLPRGDEDRRFALFVQSPVSGDDPVLQPTYFVLACRDVAR